MNRFFPLRTKNIKNQSQDLPYDGNYKKSHGDKKFGFEFKSFKIQEIAKEKIWFVANFQNGKFSASRAKKLIFEKSIFFFQFFIKYPQKMSLKFFGNTFKTDLASNCITKQNFFFDYKCWDRILVDSGIVSYNDINIRSCEVKKATPQSFALAGQRTYLIHYDYVPMLCSKI